MSISSTLLMAPVGGLAVVGFSLVGTGWCRSPARKFAARCHAAPVGAVLERQAVIAHGEIGGELPRAVAIAVLVEPLVRLIEPLNLQGRKPDPGCRDGLGFADRQREAPDRQRVGGG